MLSTTVTITTTVLTTIMKRETGTPLQTINITITITETCPMETLYTSTEALPIAYSTTSQKF